jgi:hypothetical protein
VIRGTGQAIPEQLEQRSCTRVVVHNALQLFLAEKRLKITESCWQPIRTEYTFNSFISYG